MRSIYEEEKINLNKISIFAKKYVALDVTDVADQKNK